MTVLRNGRYSAKRQKHKCRLPDGYSLDLGSIIECDECYKKYKLKLDDWSRYWRHILFYRKGKQ